MYITQFVRLSMSPILNIFIVESFFNHSVPYCFERYKISINVVSIGVRNWRANTNHNERRNYIYTKKCKEIKITLETRTMDWITTKNGGYSIPKDDDEEEEDEKFFMRKVVFFVIYLSIFEFHFPAEWVMFLRQLKR